MTQPHLGSLSSRPRDWSWPFWPVVPLYPYGQRRTIRTEVLQGTLWTFEQIQGVLYVVTPIRMTVVKLEAGGLLVYAPVAPTAECIRLVQELVAQYGDVTYIISPTVSGIEHKVFVGPFSRHFPHAQVFVAPHQWSFPLNLPLSWLGLPLGRTHCLPTDSSQAPFVKEFDYAILGPINLGLGIFEEAAFFHRRSRTLLLTDTIIAVPQHPPEIVQLDPYPLLFHARETAFETAEDTPILRQKGWQRIVLFTLYFAPSALEVLSLSQTWHNAKNAPDRSRKAYLGLFPFKWKPNWQQSFNTLLGDGHLGVAPVLKTLILNRAPQETLDWADQIASWNFQRIIPCHFASAEVRPHQFLEAFAFLKQEDPTEFLLADYKPLRDLEQGLNRAGILPPPTRKV